ncbi:recombinase family protein [Anaerovorax odorimutans]|uniref:recombinase family protein n=1 Tax=Anaerovorax odorimutans TaxID=109327 RepID=UPI0003F8295A|nr:recombinase family protein [Anaerovorax odorimutans]
MSKVAIYCRLSDEDEYKKSPEDYSESIQNQKNMLTIYAMEKNWDIYKIYCDDDFSGADAKRPEYNKLIKDAEDRKFDIVLCKTQSRFTRDLEQLEKYVHTQFVEWGIRFISVIDNADTEIKGNKKSRQINGLINEWYLEDLSDNVKAVLLSKKKQGKFIGAFPPYGYLKDPNDKNHLIIDKDTAPIITRIFNLYIKGYSLRKIALILNNDMIPCPVKYKQEILGLAYKVDSNRTAGRQIWKDSSIHMILNNRMYIGDMVQNKSVKLSYKKNIVKRIKKEDWIIVENTHEPIIDKETFYKVSELASKKLRPDRNGNISKFAGKLKCSSCNSNLVKYSVRNRNYYRCGLAQSNKNICNGNGISEKMLENCIKEELKSNIKKYVKIEEIFKIIKVERASENEGKELEQSIKTLKKEIKNKDNLITNLYKDKCNKIISEKQFIILNKIFIDEREELIKSVNVQEIKLIKMRKSKEKIQVELNEDKEKIKFINSFLNFKEFTREVIVEVIDYIVIENLKGKNNKKIEIHWNF